jgi:hypothetical protein
MVTFRDRVKELRRVPASELQANPKNWRRHPASQRAALQGILEDVGFADAVIARETPDGLELIDGHLRQEVMEDQVVPVLIVDVTEEEADKLLATLDPLAAMATTDTDALLRLLGQTAIHDPALDTMLEALSNGVLSPMTGLTEPVLDNPYTQTVDIPIYEPTGPQPSIDSLVDRDTADRLIDEIRQAELPEEVRQFLLDAAERHVAFNFQRIANYYAHSAPDIQALMERSALVIVDYDQAIENGFMRLKEDIDAAFHEDYPNA